MVLRVNAGDETALPEYARWIRERTPEQLGDSTEGAFKPMFSYPEHAAIAQAAEQMFNATGSPWNPLLKLDAPNAFRAEAVFEHWGLIRLAAFRAQLKRVLKDTRQVGTVTIVSEDSIRVEIPNVGTSGQGRNRWRGKLPKAGTTFDLRVCDRYASLLSQHKELLEYELFWSDAEKDKAIATCLERLESIGD